MYYRKFVCLLLTLCVFSSSVANGRTVTLDGTSCGKCQLESMLSTIAGGALSQIDDVVIKGVPNAIYTISKPVICRAMNITSGTVNLASTMDLRGNLWIANGASLVINGVVKGASNIINVDGSILINGGNSIVGQLNCAGKLNINAGSLTVNGLLAAAGSLPVVSGAGQLINNGKCIFNSIPSVVGNAQFIVNGATQLTKGISCLGKAAVIVNADADLNILGGSSIFSSPVALASNAGLQLTSGNSVFNGINGAAGSVLTIVNGAANMNGPSKCHNIDLTGTGSINVNANTILNAIKAAATANVNVANSGILNVNTKADINSMLNLKDTASIIISNKATANLLGGVNSQAQSTIHALDNSILNMGKQCTTSQPIIMGKQAILNAIAGAHQWTNGIQSQVNSIVNVGSDSKVTANKDCTFGVLNLASGSNVNINSGTTIVNGPLSSAQNSALAVTNAILNLKADSVLKAPLDINTGAKAIFDAKADLLAGLKAHADAQIDINNKLNILGTSDIKSTTNINADAILNFGGAKDVVHKCSGDLIADAKSTLNVANGAILHLDGQSTLNGIHKLIDGSHIIVNGDANIITGLQSSGIAPSHLTVGSAGSCILGNLPMPSMPSFPSIPGFPSMPSNQQPHNQQPSNQQPTNQQPSSGSPSSINGNIIINAGGSLDVLGKLNCGQTIQNMGSLMVTQPIVVSGPSFSQVDAKAVCNLLAGGSIESKVIDFTKGTIQGVGALKCGTCNLANNIAANLNVVGNVKMAPTAVVYANIDALIAAAASKANQGTKQVTDKAGQALAMAQQFVPMIACSGTADIAGNLQVVASAVNQAKIDAGTVFKFISAPVVKGNLSSVTCLTSGVAQTAQGAAAAAASKVWSLVQSPCKCDCSVRKN